jgi:hypothetical protein
MILMRGVQIVHFGSLTCDEWDIVIAASATPDIHDLAVDQMVASGLEGGSRAAQLRVNTRPGWPSGVSGPCPAGSQPPAM